MSEPIYRVSSSTTLFWTIFLPTFWIVFFGSLVLLLLIGGGEISPLFGSLLTKLVLVVCYLLFFVFLYMTIMRFKRVEMSIEGFFVTNYFKTYRYSYESLKSIEELDLLLMKIAVFRLHERSSFGKKIYFIRRSKVWNEFIEKHSHLLPRQDQQKTT